MSVAQCSKKKKQIIDESAAKHIVEWFGCRFGFRSVVQRKFQTERWTETQLDTTRSPETKRVNPHHDAQIYTSNASSQSQLMPPKARMYSVCRMLYMISIPNFKVSHFSIYRGLAWTPTMPGSHLTKWHVESNEIRTVRLAGHGGSGSGESILYTATSGTVKKQSGTVRAQMFQYKESTHCWGYSACAV